MFGSLIAGFASGEAMAAIRRLRRAAVYYTIAGILGFFGVVFLLVAAFIWAARRYGAIEAALGFGIGFVVLAGITLAIHMITARVRMRRAARQRNSDMAKVAVAASLAVLPSLLRGKVGVAALIVPAVAALAYGIYRENSGGELPDEDLDI